MPKIAYARTGPLNPEITIGGHTWKAGDRIGEVVGDPAHMPVLRSMTTTTLHKDGAPDLYQSVDVPEHREMQCYLVKINDHGMDMETIPCRWLTVKDEEKDNDHA